LWYRHTTKVLDWKARHKFLDHTIGVLRDIVYLGKGDRNHASMEKVGSSQIAAPTEFNTAGNSKVLFAGENAADESISRVERDPQSRSSCTNKYRLALHKEEKQEPNVKGDFKLYKSRGHAIHNSSRG